MDVLKLKAIFASQGFENSRNPTRKLKFLAEIGYAVVRDKKPEIVDFRFFFRGTQQASTSYQSRLDAGVNGGARSHDG